MRDLMGCEPHIVLPHVTVEPQRALDHAKYVDNTLHRFIRRKSAPLEDWRQLKHRRRVDTNSCVRHFVFQTRGQTTSVVRTHALLRAFKDKNAGGVEQLQLRTQHPSYFVRLTKSKHQSS